MYLKLFFKPPVQSGLKLPARTSKPFVANGIPALFTIILPSAFLWKPLMYKSPYSPPTTTLLLTKRPSPRTNSSLPSKIDFTFDL
ncbi:hypothetical protein D3C84_1013200 [compost metagenome]